MFRANGELERFMCSFGALDKPFFHPLLGKTMTTNNFINIPNHTGGHDSHLRIEWRVLSKYVRISCTAIARAI